MSQTKKVDDGVVSSTSKEEGLAHKQSTFDTIVPQGETSVNSNYMQNEGENTPNTEDATPRQSPAVNVVPGINRETRAAQEFSNNRPRYFEDFDGQYYKLTLTVGKNGEINTVYNIGKIKEAPFPLVAQRLGTKNAGGNKASKESIAQPNANSQEKNETNKIPEGAKPKLKDISTLEEDRKTEYTHLYDKEKVSKDYLNSTNKEIENAIVSIRSGDIDSVPDVINVAELDEAVKNGVAEKNGNVKYKSKDILKKSEGYAKMRRGEIPHNEKRQLEDYIIRKNNRTDNIKPIDCKEIGNNFYMWRNHSNTDYEVVEKLHIEGNEDLIEFIREGVKSGTYRKTEKIRRVLNELDDGYRNDDRRGVIGKERQTNINNGEIFERESKGDRRGDSGRGTKDIEGRKYKLKDVSGIVDEKTEADAVLEAEMRLAEVEKENRAIRDLNIGLRAEIQKTKGWKINPARVEEIV